VHVRQNLPTRWFVLAPSTQQDLQASLLVHGWSAGRDACRPTHDVLGEELEEEKDAEHAA
jgi:hypothetical protein